MRRPVTDPQELADQYRDASNLNARIRLHQRFTTNPHSLHRWEFDQFNIPSAARVLEIGCGSGRFWTENADRIPENWEIHLTDLSPGMLQEAKRSLEGAPGSYLFGRVDAERIPYSDGYFDAVIANHMLYHVRNRSRALAEVRRVLKPDGSFYSLTNGATNMLWLKELIARFVPGRDSEPDGLPSGSSPTNPPVEPLPFYLENGGEELRRHFRFVDLKRYESALLVTEAQPIVDYVLSIPGIRNSLSLDRITEMIEFIRRELDLAQGALRINKDAGLFIARPGSHVGEPKDSGGPPRK